MSGHVETPVSAPPQQSGTPASGERLGRVFEQAAAQAQAQLAALQAEQAAKAAQSAAEQAAQQAAHGAGSIPTPPSPPGATNVSVGPDGRMTVANPDGSTTIVNADGSTTHIRADGEVEHTGVPGVEKDDIPPQVVNVIDGFFFTVAFIAIGTPLARALARRMDRSPKGRGVVDVPPDLGERMDRLEHAVDSIAVEVERISEGQRFTTRLLTDRNEGAALERPAPRKDSVGGVTR